MNIQPYLSFEGQAEEAIEFYKSALGAECTLLMRMGDAPEGACCGENSAKPPAHKVMHANLQVGDAELHLSDGMCSGKPEFKGICLSLSLKDEAEVRSRYENLSKGGEPVMPLEKTFFNPLFGMVKDRFGVTWNLMVQVQAPVPVNS